MLIARPPRPTVILLVRHGMTPTTGRILPGRARGLHLSDVGRRQAEVAARRIAALPRVAAVYSSPLERARETAEAIAGARGMTVQREPGLLECDVGAWTGRSLRRASKTREWRIVQRTPSLFRFPGGESFAEMQVRLVDTVVRLVGRHRGRTLVAVSHADPIKIVLSYLLGAPLDHFQRLEVAPASISVVAFHERPHVLTVNSVAGDLAALGF